MIHNKLQISMFFPHVLLDMVNLRFKPAYLVDVIFGWGVHVNFRWVAPNLTCQVSRWNNSAGRRMSWECWMWQIWERKFGSDRWNGFIVPFRTALAGLQDLAYFSSFLWHRFFCWTEMKNEHFGVVYDQMFLRFLEAMFSEGLKVTSTDIILYHIYLYRYM